MSASTDANRALVLTAMTSLFQRKDPLAVERLYAPDYVQHNPSIPQGREALAKLVAQLPAAVFYEPGLIIADGAYVAIHGRIRGWAPNPQVVVDIFRIEDGRLAEHWDVLQDEAAVAGSKSGVAMFSSDEARVQAAVNEKWAPSDDADLDYDALMQANLRRVFGERNAGRRMDAIAELYAEDATLHEPHASAEGHVAICDAVSALLANLPEGFAFTSTGAAVGHHGVARLRWSSGLPG
jgi:predicted SnoaL-like aldol condensation-catalyzing enzyme